MSPWIDTEDCITPRQAIIAQFLVCAAELAVRAGHTEGEAFERDVNWRMDFLMSHWRYECGLDQRRKN